LNRWLKTQIDDPIASAVLNDQADPEDVRAMAARYLLNSKRSDGLPLDPVAKFHLGNGAEIYDIHSNADTSANGKATSSGAMVNYLYDLTQTERNHEDFALASTVASSKSVRALSNATFVTKTKELSQ
jgi:malonyl-CoA decarboxylase